jgi:hypothetical protein
MNDKENMNVWVPEKLPFWQRFKVYWDFESQIKHIWLTGYILITWEWEWGDWSFMWFRKTLDVGWYKGGSYERH